MAKTGDEPWGYCDRCGFRYALKDLKVDPKTGFSFCTVRIICTDEKNFTDYEAAQSQFTGLIFEP